MRIDTFSKVSQLYQVNSAKKTGNVKFNKTSDKLEISQSGKDYQIAKTAVASAADVRMDKVNDIKNRMEAGTYNVSIEDVANNMVERMYNNVV